MNKIKIGSIVKDLITGYTGTVTQQVEQLNGNIQYAIQRMQTESETTYPDAIQLDSQTLEVISEKYVHLVSPPVASDIILGSIVTDIASNFEGTVIEKIIFFNGCVKFCIIPAVKDSSMFNSVPDISCIDSTRLKMKNKGISNETKQDYSGGPSKIISPLRPVR